MSAYEHFRIQMNRLFADLRASEDCVFHALHVMEANPTDDTISAYEKALDDASAIRKKIGELHNEEMRQRSVDA